MIVGFVVEYTLNLVGLALTSDSSYVTVSNSFLENIY